MPPVKGQYATLLRGLGELFSVPPVKRLDYEELGSLLGATEEAVKTWARRGIPPWAQLKILQLAEEQGLPQLEAAKQLLRGVYPTAAIETTRRVAEARQAPSGGAAKRGVGSATVRVEEHEALWRGFRVLASRIARTVQTTIAGNELGYNAHSRAMLADSLELFARELDRRCGEKVCGDIWEVVAWLRKPDGK